MPAIRASELRRRSECEGHAKTFTHLCEALESGDLKPADFSIRDLAINLIEDGAEFVQACGPQKSGRLDLLEAGMAVNTAQFAQITGQIVYTKMLEEFHDRAFVFSDLIPTQQTTLNGERIPGIGGIGDMATAVGEGEPFPLAGLSQDYIDTPQTVKRGLIVPVTKEAIFFDRTGLVLKRAGEVGYWLGLNKEKRAIDCVVDENVTTHRYRWRDTTIATYNDNTGTHTWDNLSASTALEDWTDIDAAEQLLANMLDPNTGEPILMEADTIIYTPQLAATVHYILYATGMSRQIGGFATSGNLSRTDAPNLVTAAREFSANYMPVTSRLLPTRMATDTTWYLGSPKRAFAYMENWPLTVKQAPPNLTAEFERDIVAQFRADERGAYATLEPRLMVKCTA